MKLNFGKLVHSRDLQTSTFLPKTRSRAFNIALIMYYHCHSSHSTCAHTRRDFWLLNWYLCVINSMCTTAWKPMTESMTLLNQILYFLTETRLFASCSVDEYYVRPHKDSLDHKLFSCLENRGKVDIK